MISKFVKIAFAFAGIAYVTSIRNDDCSATDLGCKLREALRNNGGNHDATRAVTNQYLKDIAKKNNGKGGAYSHVSVSSSCNGHENHSTQVTMTPNEAEGYKADVVFKKDDVETRHEIPDVQGTVNLQHDAGNVNVCAPKAENCQ